MIWILVAAFIIWILRVIYWLGYWQGRVEEYDKRLEEEENGLKKVVR